MRSSLVCAAAALVCARLTATTTGQACAPAPPEGSFVSIAAESAIIVWDEETHTEHFIRRASFQSDAQDFGFLVPTPTKPELAEARDEAFSALSGLLQPEVVHRAGGVEPTALLFMFFLARSKSEAPTAAASAPVRVLEETRVAGYDAVVLEADDAGALAEWLRAHGYAKRPALDEWLRPYVDAKWKLTAFKIADGGGAAPSTVPRGLGTDAVRMTFTTTRPFFPYREPRDQRESVPPQMSSPRSLRVFFVGPKRVSATIGDGSTTFAGKTTWASPLGAGASLLPVAAPKGAWLTVFEDDASPRPGVDELWLDPASDQGVVKPPPFIVYDPVPLPLDVVALVLGVGAVVVVKVRRRRRASAT